MLHVLKTVRYQFFFVGGASREAFLKKWTARSYKTTLGGLVALLK